MKFEIFKPMELAPDLPQATCDSYQAIAKRLVKVTGEQLDIEKARNKIRTLEPVEVDSAAIDKMRKLSFGMMELLREELRVRADLTRWFGDFRDALTFLAKEVKESDEKARQDVIAAMVSAGFAPESISESIIGIHPTVVKIMDRLRRLTQLRTVLGNEESSTFSFPARGNNLKRIEEINAALREALNNAGSPLAMAAFV